MTLRLPPRLALCSLASSAGCPATSIAPCCSTARLSTHRTNRSTHFSRPSIGDSQYGGPWGCSRAAATAPPCCSSIDRIALPNPRGLFFRPRLGGGGGGGGG